MDTRRLTGQAMACSILALGAAIASSSSAAATVIFGSVETYANSSATAFATGKGTALPVLSGGPDDEYTTSFPTGSILSFSTSQAEAVVNSKKTGPTVQAEASDTEKTQAYFFDTTAGTVDFAGSTTAKVDTSGAGAFAQSDLGFFAYNFTIDTKSSVTIDYDVKAKATYKGFFPGYSSYIFDADENYYLEDTAALNSKGSYSTILDPGTYYLEFDNSIGNDFSTSTHGLSSASAVADFGFQISAVPEPATWGMMLVGFGGLGFAMRRARRQPIAATA
jgi:hypothetical protein